MLCLYELYLLVQTLKHSSDNWKIVYDSTQQADFMVLSADGVVQFGNRRKPYELEFHSMSYYLYDGGTKTSQPECKINSFLFIR